MKAQAIVRRILGAIDPGDGDPMAVLAGLLADTAADAVTTNRMLLRIILGLCRPRAVLCDPDAERTMVACLLREAHQGEFDCVAPDDLVVPGASAIVDALRCGILAEVIGKARVAPRVESIIDPCDIAIHEMSAPARLYDEVMASSRALAVRAAELRATRGQAREVVARTIVKLAARRRILDAAHRVVAMVEADMGHGATRVALAEALTDAEAL